MPSSAENNQILSPDAISNFIFVSNVFTAITLVFGILSILVIVRYANRSMNDYKYFLLNITLTIFCSDLCFQFFCRPYLLYPVMGLCMVGSIEGPLVGQFGVETTMRVISSIQVFCTISSMAAIANATIHRYSLAAKLTHQEAGLLYDRYFLGFIMLVMQLLWPAIGCLLCLRMDLRPEEAVRENLVVNQLITERSSSHACFLASHNIFTIIKTVYPTIGILLHGATCALGSMLIVLLCWHKITQAQKGHGVSRKTISMEKQLMISLGIQAFTPNILFLTCLGVVILSFISGSEWTGTIGSLAFRVGSAHTTANFLIMCYTIPAFHRGLVRDFRHFVCRKKTTPTFLWGTTSSSRI